eukprot:295417_1
MSFQAIEVQISTNNLEEWKQEEEQKYDYKPNDVKTEFTQHHINDDQKCGGDITKCNVVGRIIHLLDYYNQQIKYNIDNNVLLYEYIESLGEYSISLFMEDWYHTKTKHLKSENDYRWLKHNAHSNCDNDPHTSKEAMTFRNLGSLSQLLRILGH